MTAGQWFWIIYVIIVVFCGVINWPFSDRRFAGTSLAILVLLGLLGWGIFGPPIR